MTVLAYALLATPFLFGILRFVNTGSDWRYLVIAVASTVGAYVVLTRRTLPGEVIARLFTSVVGAALAAVAVGARSVISVGVVATSFALCSAGGAVLLARARSSRQS